MSIIIHQNQNCLFPKPPNPCTPALTKYYQCSRIWISRAIQNRWVTNPTPSDATTTFQSQCNYPNYGDYILISWKVICWSSMTGIHIYLASSARNCFAAFTKFVNAGTTSAYFLVFKPQSGLIHRTFDSSTANIWNTQYTLEGKQIWNTQCRQRYTNPGKDKQLLNSK